MEWETIKNLLEIAIVPALLIFLEIRKSTKERREDAAGSVLIKETTDKTEITTLLLNQGQERYKDLIAEINRLKADLDRVQSIAQRMLIENMHLRSLAGIGPDDVIPGMRKAIQDDIDQSETPDTVNDYPAQ